MVGCSVWAASDGGLLKYGSGLDIGSVDLYGRMCVKADIGDITIFNYLHLNNYRLVKETEMSYTSQRCPNIICTKFGTFNEIVWLGDNILQIYSYIFVFGCGYSTIRNR